jgi:signal transduction histidine kinase
VTIIPHDDFLPLKDVYDALKDGSIVTLYNEEDEPNYYRKVREGDSVIALGPLISQSNDRAAWVVPIFYSLVALAVFIWLQPLRRDLSNLQASALAFGAQKFSTRVAVPERSWLSPVGQAFNLMAEKIQWLVQSHRELTQAVSHELRTPLARMRFNLEMLSSRKDQTRHFDALQKNIEELNMLIDEMLGYAELNEVNLKTHLESIPLDKWLESYLSQYEQNTDQPNIKLMATKLEQQLAVDIRLLARAMDNLIGNALRYASSEIVVQTELDAQMVCIRVSDDGPGIAEENREKVTAPFTQLESTSKTTENGFGLGLAIIQRIMELHSGSMYISESFLGGAAITIKFPLHS